MDSRSIKLGLIIGLEIMLIVSAITPTIVGHKTSLTNGNLMDEHVFNRLSKHYFPEMHSSETRDLSIQSNNVKSVFSINSKVTTNSSLVETEKEKPSYLAMSIDGPMNSAWPMHGHDVYHTGRSPYSTVDDIGFEKWRFATEGWACGSPVIDDQGIIYIGAEEIYAIYPNGTLKWKYDIPHRIESTAAIDENGIIYVGTVEAMPNYLYAIYTSNGTLKWKYCTGDHVSSSPAIGADGCIYFGDWTGYIHALYPNGTIKWIYDTGDVVTSSPAIGLDGTIYCGSHDNYVYAFYPDNGTVRWKFDTGSWVHGIPTIGTDGTVYIGSDNGYMYAFYPSNGTMKWQCSVGSMSASPSLDEEGTLYFGVWEKIFYAIYSNGTIKWSFNVGEKIWGSSAAISNNGYIYFGTCDLEDEGGLDIVVLNSDGTLKWRRHIGSLFSSPAIGVDGTVYIGASTNDGYLYAFGSPDPNAPETPVITGSTNGRVERLYEYTFTTIDPNGDDVFYYIMWGDGTSDGWLGPYGSSDYVKVSHIWSKTGTYLIQAQAKDTNDLKSDWSTLQVTMPRSRTVINSLFYRFLEKFPLLERLLDLMS